MLPQLGEVCISLEVMNSHLSQMSRQMPRQVVAAEQDCLCNISLCCCGGVVVVLVGGVGGGYRAMHGHATIRKECSGPWK